MVRRSRRSNDYQCRFGVIALGFIALGFTVLTAPSPMATAQVAVTHPKYRPDIDGLRTLAVGSVLIFHAFPQLLPGGFAGVDIFFVISGFLISTILLKSLQAGQFSLWHFYERRIRRLFPVLIVVLLFSLAMGWWLLPPLEYGGLGKYTVGGAAFVANLLFAADSGYFSDLNETNPLLHLWSLGIEEQFYLLWPLILWFFYWRRWPFSLAIGLCLVLSFAYSVYLTSGNLKLAFYIPFSRFWEMLAGAVLAWWVLQPWSAQLGSAALRRGLGQVTSVAGLVFFILSLCLLTPNHSFPGWWAWLPVLSAFCFIAAGPHTIINKYVLSRPLMVWFGLISYPLYLWHWPLLAYFHGMSYALPSQWHTPILVGLLALSVLLAWLSYKYIENPLRGGSYGRPKLIGLIVGLLVVIALGSGVWAAKGIPSRIPQSVQDLLSAELRTETWVESLREHECHNMIYHQPADLNATLCLPSEKPSLLLWGDSHAASLYSAFKAWGDEHGVTIGQFTTDATPPLRTDQKNHTGRSYKEVFDAVLAQLKKDPPSVIVLHAFWVAFYAEKPLALQEDLVETAALLQRELPQTELVVLGPVTNWKAPISRIFYQYYTLHHQVIPSHTFFGLHRDAQQIDQQLKSLKHRANSPLHYYSLIDYLCTEQGCLFRLPTNEISVENMGYVDETHINTGTARWLVQQLSPELLPLLNSDM